MSQVFNEHEIEWTDEKIARLWNYYSKTVRFNASYFTKSLGSEILKLAAKILPPWHQKVILDYGCGAGFLYEHIVKLALPIQEYIGLDFSDKSIEALQCKSQHQIPLQSVVVQTLPSIVKSNSVDVCFLIEVIEHLNDNYLQQTIQEITRVLKKDGYLIVSTPNQEDLLLSKNFCPECGAIYHQWQHLRSFSSKDVENLLIQTCQFKLKYISTRTFEPKDKGVFLFYLRCLRNKFLSKKSTIFAVFQKID